MVRMTQTRDSIYAAACAPKVFSQNSGKIRKNIFLKVFSQNSGKIRKNIFKVNVLYYKNIFK